MAALDTHNIWPITVAKVYNLLLVVFPKTLQINGLSSPYEARIPSGHRAKVQ
jgi:hypothetical protein